MSDHLKLQLLDAQKELIAAIAGAHCKEQMKALRIVAETQYNLSESFLPMQVVNLTMPVDGPMTMQ